MVNKNQKIFKIFLKDDFRVRSRDLSSVFLVMLVLSLFEANSAIKNIMANEV